MSHVREKFTLEADNPPLHTAWDLAQKPGGQGFPGRGGVSFQEGIRPKSGFNDSLLENSTVL